MSTIADGIAVKKPGDLTYELCKKYVDEIVTVTDDEISAALLALMEQHKLVTEGAGAVAVAAAMFGKVDLAGKKTVCLLSGGNIDVTILSQLVLDKLLGIKDLRTDKRIDFVGGIRGLGELKKRVDSGEMKVALALYPVSMKQLMDIADSGNIMPPKTTWFEPKLRSGLVIHKLV